ncbi:hypothetical protein CHS0354_024327, partial [Potamilus streckersoni]
MQLTPSWQDRCNMSAVKGQEEQGKSPTHIGLDNKEKNVANMLLYAIRFELPFTKYTLLICKIQGTATIQGKLGEMSNKT